MGIPFFITPVHGTSGEYFTKISSKRATHRQTFRAQRLTASQYSVFRQTHPKKSKAITFFHQEVGFAHHIYYLRSSFFLCPSLGVTQVQGHQAGSPTPSPLRHVPSFLSRVYSFPFFSRRVESNCTYLCCYKWVLSASLLLFFFFAD